MFFTTFHLCLLAWICVVLVFISVAMSEALHSWSACSLIGIETRECST